MDFFVYDKDTILNALDPNKETILFWNWGYFKNVYNHIAGFGTVTYETLKKQYNIISIGFLTRNEEAPENFIHINKPNLARWISENCQNKQEYGCEGKEYFDANHQKIYDYIAETLSWLPPLKYLVGFSGEWILVLQPYSHAGRWKYKYNEFHDYVGDDADTIQEIRDIIGKTVNDYIYFNNPLAFQQLNGALVYQLVKYLVDTHKATLQSIDSFIIDPVPFTPIVDSMDAPNRNFYFVDDHRGTRNLTRYPIAELQHLVYDQRWKPEETTDDLFGDTLSAEPHSKKFVFMGTILDTKGDRLALWDRYLKDLQLDDSVFYIPPVRNGIIYKKPSEKQLKRRQSWHSDKMEQVYNEVMAHPLYGGYLLPHQVNATLDEYRYSLVLRCVSFCDSLNYRPVQYAYHEVLPLFDPQYDPSYLQVPKDIQDRLIVQDALDIQKKVEYFENNPTERKELLQALWDHFEIDKWLQPGYAEQAILEYYP